MKTFPGVRALTDVDLAIFPGEVHAVMGENGAGKSIGVPSARRDARKAGGCALNDGLIVQDSKQERYLSPNQESR